MNYKTIKDNYVSKYVDHQTTKDTIDKKIVRLKKKREKLEFPYWTENLLLPVLKQIAEATPEVTWDFMGGKDLNTFGMRCECPVFAHDEDGNTVVTLCFTPGDLAEGELYYDIETSDSNTNSIADLNGFKNKTKLIESVDEIILFVKSKIKSSTEGCFYYKKMKFSPVRKFNNKEKLDIKKGTGFMRTMSSIGISNYKELPERRNDFVLDWNYDEFYAEAKKKGMDKADIYLLNDNKYVVPGENELFEYKNFS